MEEDARERNAHARKKPAARLYLKSISSLVHVDRGSGNRNEPLKMVMSGSRKNLETLDPMVNEMHMQSIDSDRPQRHNIRVGSLEKPSTPSSASGPNFNLSSILPEVQEDKAEEERAESRQYVKRKGTKTSGRKRLMVLTRQSSGEHLPELSSPHLRNDSPSQFRI